MWPAPWFLVYSLSRTISPSSGSTLTTYAPTSSEDLRHIRHDQHSSEVHDLDAVQWSGHVVSLTFFLLCEGGNYNRDSRPKRLSY